MTYAQEEAIVMKLEMLEQEGLFVAKTQIQQVQCSAKREALYWVLSLLDVKIDKIRQNVTEIKNATWNASKQYAIEDMEKKEK